jgi:flagellar hook-associated protein 1 FlgK
MSLSVALGIAQNSLLNTQRQMSVVSRNISDASNPDYARRSAVLSSLAPGSRIVEIHRATNAALFRQNLSALSGWTAQQAVVAGMEQLSISVLGVDNASSPAVLIGDLQEAIQTYSATPSNRTLAENAVEAARAVVRTLNEGTAAVQGFRTDMDGQIATAVEDLNRLLADFKNVNDRIVSGTRAGRDILDELDQRDALLKKIAEYVPISTISRADNDTMIVTADGTTLFETVPRHVGFDQTANFGPATVGEVIRIDGVPIFGGFGGNTTASGSLAAMVQMRDSIATGMQIQLDEIARGLIAAFAESDPAGLSPDAPGLFTWTGAPGLPPAGVLITGLAGEISLNPAADPQAGGDPELLRDGIAFDANPGNFAGFTDLLLGFTTAMDQPMDYVSADGSLANLNLMDYSTGAISWFEAGRKNAAAGAETKSALMMRTGEALSNITQVNVDEEMALMLELEHSYAASARMMSTIDNMMATLLDIVR